MPKPVKKQPETPAAIPSGLPLFFKQPAVLTHDRHARAGVTLAPDYSFARDTNSISINVVEFIEASKSYPIVYGNDESASPMVIVGLEKSNYFVNDDNTWNPDHYIPAYVRQYPFIFFEQPDSDQFLLCIDEGAPHYRDNSADGTAPIYNADGTISELGKNALEFCSAFYRHHSVTKNFCADLKVHNLLQPYQSSAQLASGAKISLTGFSIIDETAFNALPQEVFLEFRTKGWLPFIYLSLTSISNWQKLVAMADKAGK